MDKIQFETKKDGVTSLTDQIKKCVEKSGVKSGLLCAFITHTTAALTVNSFWDVPAVQKRRQIRKIRVPKRP